MVKGERDGSGLAVGLFTGALVGAGVALLFAPKSGRALRDDLGESLANMRDAVARRTQDVAATAGVELDNLQERVDRVTEAVEIGVREVVGSAAKEASEQSRRL